MGTTVKTEKTVKALEYALALPYLIGSDEFQQCIKNMVATREKIRNNILKGHKPQ